MEVIRSASVKTKWLEIWFHYQNIKKKYKLTSYDIFSQLNSPCSLVFRQYLSVDGDKRLPSTRQGTIGRQLWDILIPGLHLSGGGALIKNLSTLWEKKLRMPVKVVDEPLAAVARGTAEMLDHIELLQRIQKGWDELV